MALVVELLNGERLVLDSAQWTISKHGGLELRDHDTNSCFAEFNANEWSGVWNDQMLDRPKPDWP